MLKIAATGTEFTRDLSGLGLRAVPYDDCLVSVFQALSNTLDRSFERGSAQGWDDDGNQLKPSSPLGNSFAYKSAISLIFAGN